MDELETIFEGDDYEIKYDPDGKSYAFVISNRIDTLDFDWLEESVNEASDAVQAHRGNL